MNPRVHILKGKASHMCNIEAFPLLEEQGQQSEDEGGKVNLKTQKIHVP